MVKISILSQRIEVYEIIVILDHKISEEIY